MLPKINKADMTGMVEAIKEYLRSCHDDTGADLANIIIKTILVKTYGDYPKNKTPDGEMYARMLHLPPDRKKYGEKDTILVKKQTPEYKIINADVYHILNKFFRIQICI